MAGDDALSRREFITRSAQFAAGAALLASGCGGPEAPSSDASPDAPPDLDTTPDLDAPDLDAPDLDAPDASADATEDTDQEMEPPPHTPFVKPPYVQLLSARAARLRFETRSEELLPVLLSRRGSIAPPEAYPMRNDWRHIQQDWPVAAFKSRVKHTDDPGFHNLQEALFEDIEPGAVYDWIVQQGSGVEARGSFRAPPAFGQSFRLGWISDTMAPIVEPCAAALATLSPELVIHGGDLQYMTNPIDTWSGLFHALSPLTSQAPFHTCIGNHEYEDFDEFEQQYRRLFDGHGFQGSNIDYSYIDYGGVRFLLMNSEGDLFVQNSLQWQWLVSQLEAVRDDPTLHYAVVAFHRPYFTFSRSRPSFASRDLLHPLLRDFNVPLVFTGHNHCYERFEVDGITYIMDGGGGAGIYSINASRTEVFAVRPEDEALRKFASESHGFTIADFASNGSIKLARYNMSGMLQDTHEIG